MTAEIAILNREAVAIAADSAATFSDGASQKIFSSANKIFALSKHHPIGIMIYGNALFMGVPWETIIKVYEKTLLMQNSILFRNIQRTLLNLLKVIQNFFLRKNKKNI